MKSDTVMVYTSSKYKKMKMKPRAKKAMTAVFIAYLGQT
jgi:hypothetical protein